MSAADDLDVAVPGRGSLAGGGGPSPRRILVPVRSPSESAEALAFASWLCGSVSGVLHLVHVRCYDPPLAGCPGRFYPESADQAENTLDEALLTVWSWGVQATTSVVQARRGDVARTISRYSGAWHADLIVLSRRPRSALGRLVLGSVPDRVMREAGCPVLAVHPGPRRPAGRGTWPAVSRGGSRHRRDG